jgi:diguanylate cyclase (GGDEF)-like protein/PAS domain S-box-containing protein
VTLVSVVEWMELGAFVALAAAATRRWLRRREEAAAWLAIMFSLLGAVLLADRFVPVSARNFGEWYDRGVIVDLALVPYCLWRFTSAFPRATGRSGLPERTTILLVVGAFLLPDVPGGPPASWPWWYGVYVGVFLVAWTSLSMVCADRLWRCGRGQPGITRQRMRMLAVAVAVLDVTIFVLADSGQQAWPGLASGLLFLVGFAPPPRLRARWRRVEIEAFGQAQADLMRADTADHVINLMLPHAAGLVGAEAAVLVDGDGRVRHWHGTTEPGAASIAARLPAPDGGEDTVVAPGLVAVRLGQGWMAVATTAATPFFGHDELGLLRTLAHLAGLALDRAELFDRERANRQILAERESQLAEAQRTARLGSYSWDLRTGEVVWSDEMHRLFGFRPGEVTDHGAAFTGCLHPEDRECVIEAWKASRHTPVPSSIEYRVVLPSGETRWMHGRIRPVLDDRGAPIRIIGTIQDITERKAAEDAFAFQANHDALTGLPNRTLFLDRLAQALARRNRRRSGVAVLFLDVDRFKWLNDSLGHAAGDELLMAVADRLRSAMRDEDSVARFGGDEFVVCCEDVAYEAEAEALATRVAAALAAPVTIAGEETTVTASIGIAFAPPNRGDMTPESLVRDADAAMYRAKDQGRNRHELFDSTTRALALARHETANALRRGIGRGDLVVYYQPNLDLASGRVVGVEALVRWRHPQRGVLPPGEFMALAEETGLVVPLGAAVLVTACRQLAAWPSGDGPVALSVCVNLAARQLLAPDLPSIVEEALDDSGLEPSRLCLEITESALLEDSDSSTRALGRLKALGVSIGVDDFGTGFSSLTYLKRFPVDVLKIDRSFVDGLGRDRQDRAIVASVVDLAHAFGLTTVAEGVETAEQLEELRVLGCERGQGYLWSPPLPADLARRWITAHGGGAGRDRPVAASGTGRRHRVLLVDDDASLRTLMRLLLEDDFEVVGETGDGREAVALARHLRPDVVLLDLALPGIGGLEALPMLRAVAPDSKVVVLSGLDPGAYADAARRRGADAYHAKGSDPNCLPSMLQALLVPVPCP